MPRCDIVSPIWNQFERTKRCVESLIRHTDYPFRLILVDNASDEPARSYLESLASDPRINVKLIRNEENLGNIKAANQGIYVSDAEYVCILDNDTIVTEGWLSEMIAIAEVEPNIGIVNPISNSNGWPPPKGCPIDEYAKTLRKDWGGCYSEMATAVGFCFLISRKLIDTIGVWDEIFGMGYYEDRDYSRRAVQAGFKIAFAKGAYVYHEEHSSFRKRPEWYELQERNRAIYEARYGRPKRYLYLISKPNQMLQHKVLLDAYAKACRNNFIWIFLTEECLPMDYADHSNIDFFVLNPFWWKLSVLWKTSKRKKPFNEIFAGSESDYYWLKANSWLHRASVQKFPPAGLYDEQIPQEPSFTSS
ncbi:MAG: glycosyltransferase family 2 protein [Candidatus Omnitrophica bacterium]|nr:glycosyltransferase family 2 protein [Candidatus Omnitrophota bacterium]